MRTPRSIKQRMFYAIPTGVEQEYERDEHGEIIYKEINGKRLPVKKGKPKTRYSAAILFYNSITGELTADDLASFGADNSGKKAKITFKKSEYPFQTGTLIWKESEVKYVNGEVDPSSADYTIIGMRDIGQFFWNALLSEVVSETHY